MQNDKNVYDYILNKINSLLRDGIDYYNDKDNNQKEKLIKIYDLINETYDNKASFSFEKETFIDFEHSQENVALEVKALTDTFMKKVTDIKISVLNLQNNLSLYCNNDDKFFSTIDFREEIKQEKSDIVEPLLSKSESLLEVTDCLSDDNNKSLFDIFRKSNG